MNKHTDVRMAHTGDTKGVEETANSLYASCSTSIRQGMAQGQENISNSGRTCVVSFFTGEPYRQEAARLERSLQAVQMPYYLREIPLRCENWHRAVSLKPAYLHQCWHSLHTPLLYVDVDAVVHQNCEDYFNGLDCDFAAHWFQGPSGGYNRNRNDNWFLSGTMFFNTTPKANELLIAWLQVNKKKQTQGIWEGGGQANLAQVLLEKRVKDLRVHRLPGRYCYVFDKPWAYPEGEPRIIEHLIASRENKDSSKGKINSARRERIREIDQAKRASKEGNKI